MKNLPLNTQVKNYLSQRFGLPDEQIEVMMPEFKKTLAQHINSLTSALRQDNLIALKDAAHTIKGALLNLGFSDSAQLAQKIETESGAGNTLIDYASLIDKIRTSVFSFIDEQ
jgi:HPt (histidine-containing phosphotransfer) domain-containing protein